VDDACDRRDVADEIEIEFFVKRRVDSIRGSDKKQRIAVWGSVNDRLGTDVATGTRPVFDNEWLSETLGKPLTYQPRSDVGRAARRGRDDPAHRASRIIECHSASQKGGRSSSGSGELQKLSA